MALGKSLRAKSTKRGCLRNLDVDSVDRELGIVSHKGAMGRKRVEPSPRSLSPTKTPLKRSCSFRFNAEKSLLEALPQEILIKILCGVDHEDLDQLFHVSNSIRDATMIAKSLHFAFRTPSSKPKFANSNKSFSNLEESDKLDDVEAPNAPKQQRFYRSRLEGKKLADITVALFH